MKGLCATGEIALKNDDDDYFISIYVLSCCHIYIYKQSRDKVMSF